MLCNHPQELDLENSIYLNSHEIHADLILGPVIIMVQATAECLSKSNPEVSQTS